MDNYELVFILEKEDDNKLTAIDSIITTFSGKITDKKFQQKHNLAYPINKQKIGYYYSWFFSLDKAKVFMEKPKKELSESFNNMPTQRMVTQYIVKTKGIMDPNKTFIQETNKEGYYFEWKFIKSDFVPSSDLESLNYLKRLDII